MNNGCRRSQTRDQSLRHCHRPGSIPQLPTTSLAIVTGLNIANFNNDMYGSRGPAHPLLRGSVWQACISLQVIGTGLQQVMARPSCSRGSNIITTTITSPG